MMMSGFAALYPTYQLPIPYCRQRTNMPKFKFYDIKFKAVLAGAIVDIAGFAGMLPAGMGGGYLAYRRRIDLK